MQGEVKLKGKYTLASSVPADDTLHFIVIAHGQELGEIHLKKPESSIPGQYCGDLYMWDDEQVGEVNNVKHPGPARSVSATDRAMARAMKVTSGDLKPRAPSLGVSGRLQEWREFFGNGAKP